jgi:hypothetical protein
MIPSKKQNTFSPVASPFCFANLNSVPALMTRDEVFFLPAFGRGRWGNGFRGWQKLLPSASPLQKRPSKIENLVSSHQLPAN